MHHVTSHDPPPASHRITVTEAARLLGVTDHAVRARLRRGTLAGTKKAATWYTTFRDGDLPAIDADCSPGGTDDGTVRDTRRDVLHVHLAGEVAYLREKRDRALRQMEAERQWADTFQALGTRSLAESSRSRRPPQSTESNETPSTSIRRRWVLLRGRGKWME